MSRSWINFWLDALLLFVFCSLIAISVIVRFVFPPPLETKGWSLWGAGFEQWLSFQFGLVATLALGVLLHVMLHWSWVCGLLATKLARSKKVKIDDGLQTIYGVGLLIVVLTVFGVFLAAAQLSIRRPEY